MSDGTFLSWEEVQRLALPPNAAMLMPPIPEPAEVPALAAGPPQRRPDWLDDGFLAETTLKAANPTPSADAVPTDPEADRAAAERAEHGPGPVRLIANLLAYNALLEYAQSPRKKDDEKKRPLPAEPHPDKP